MNTRSIILLTLLSILPLSTFAQAIDNTLSYKNINSDSYFRLNYENDFFSATDIYYTQGIHVELVAPWVKQFPLSKLLVHPHFGFIRYGIGLEHDAYTPTSIGHDYILYGDHPFTAALFLKTFLIATDPEKKQRFSTALSTGIIGQGAGGRQMQESIHKWLHNVTPHGWEYQLHNDVVLNYQVDYEKQLLSYGHYFSLDADGMARAGTLSDKAAVGTTIMFGYLDDPFSATPANKKDFRLYAYEHAQVNVVGYDATLQGGLFDKSSPYVVPADNINRAVLENRFGFVVQYRRIYLEYFQSYLSREIKTQSYHVWGGIQIGFGL